MGESERWFLVLIPSAPLSRLLNGGIVLLFAFMLFENPLESTFPFLCYFDEALCFAALGVLLFGARKVRAVLGKNYSVVACLAVSVVLIGLFGNVISGYQTNGVAIAKEALAYLKFPVVAVASLYVMRVVPVDDAFKNCVLVSKVFVVTCAIFAIVNLLMPSAGFGHDVRSGLLSFKFIFSHPTFLVFSLVMALVVLEGEKSGGTPIKILCLVLLVLTMRDKAFGFVGLCLVSWALKIENKKQIAPYVLLVGAVVALVGWPKIAEYLSFSNSPRQALYSTALAISVSFFPLGGGLASIASSLSGEYYSNAYYQYGLDSMLGLSPSAFYDLGDAGFACYLGQLGFVGFFFIVLLLVKLYSLFTEGLLIGDSRRSALFILFGYILIALSVETVLTNSTGAMAAFLLALVRVGSSDEVVSSGAGLSE